MEALTFDPRHAGSLRYQPNYPDPALPPGEVLVRVRLAGICSTDLEIVRGYMGFAGVLGHEFVGTVVAGGAALEGQRVVAEINCASPPGSVPDPEARKHAPGRAVLGIAGRDGAFASCLAVPAENCHVVPDGVTDRQAVFAEPLAAAVQVTNDRPVGAAERVAVLGTGRLGILCAQVLRTQGCAPDVIGRNAHALDVCRALGLTVLDALTITPARRYDVVVECTGAPDGLSLALELVRPRGTIVLKSTFAEAPRLDLAPIVIHEIRVVGSRCGPFTAALTLLESGKIATEELISATYPLSRGAAAFEAARDPRHIKVLLHPDTNG